LRNPKQTKTALDDDLDCRDEKRSPVGGEEERREKEIPPLKSLGIKMSHFMLSPHLKLPAICSLQAKEK